MAKASPFLIDTLRQVAEKLENGADYNWGNATRCNCAHLVQALAPDAARKSLQAIRPQLDEWTEFANDYCPQSGAATDQLIDILYQHGLSHRDIHQLEYLTNRDVLAALPGGFRYLEHGNRWHVALYLRTWAALLEQKERPDPDSRGVLACRALLRLWRASGAASSGGASGERTRHELSDTIIT